MVAVTIASPKAFLILLVDGVCKFDLDYVSEVRGELLVAISLGDA